MLSIELTHLFYFFKTYFCSAELEIRKKLYITSLLMNNKNYQIKIIWTLLQAIIFFKINIYLGKSQT